MSNYLDDVPEFVFDIDKVYEEIDSKSYHNNADKVFYSSDGYNWFTMEEIKKVENFYHLSYKIDGKVRQIIMNRVYVKEIVGNRVLLYAKNLLDALNRRV